MSDVDDISSAGGPPDDTADAFAALQGWRLLMEDSEERSRARRDPANRRIPPWELLAYAERRDGVADMKMERALRANPLNMKLYMIYLGNLADASSPVAMAASGTEALSRRIGPHRMDIVQETGERWMVIRLAGDETDASGALSASTDEVGRDLGTKGRDAPRDTPDHAAYAIEARAADGTGVRIELGRPVAGTLSLPLDPAFPELAELGSILARPDSALFLIRMTGGGA